MLKKILSISLIVVTLFVMYGCSTNKHVIGSGAQGNQVQEARQWYVLWGLVPINNVDTNAMAGDAEDYTIVTEYTFVDVIIGAFTGIVTIHPRSVKVMK